MRELLLTDVLIERFDEHVAVMKNCSEPHLWDHAFHEINDSLKLVSSANPLLLVQYIVFVESERNSEMCSCRLTSTSFMEYPTSCL